MDNLAIAFEKGIDWLLAPTTISFFQENGEGTISRIGLAFYAIVTVGLIAVCVSPKLRKMFF